MNKEKIEFYMIISLALAMGFLSDYLFHGKAVGISFFVFILASVAFSLAVAKKFDQNLSKTQILILVSAVALSMATFLRASLFLGFFNTAGSAYLLVLAAVLVEEKNFFKSRFLRYFTAPILFVLESFSGAAKFIGSQKDFPPSPDKFGSEELRSVIRGIIISLPILMILGWFFYSADLVVRIYVNKFFDLFQFKIDLDLFSRILIIFAVSYIFAGIFSKIASKRKIETAEEKDDQKYTIGFIESMTVLILVELLFLAFIAIQSYYLFGGKSYVWGIDEYITYSEYAKDGFYELIKVSIVSFILLYAIDKSNKIETLKEKKTFRFLSAALFVEISIILLSSFKRLLLYVDGYGLTLPRFLAFAFLFWIFLVFFFFLYKIYLEKKSSVFIFMTFSLTIMVWIGINIANPDALIAKVNLERFSQGKELDPYYFSRLSEDAVPSIVKIFKLNVNEEIKEKVAMDLDWRYASGSYKCSMIDYNLIIRDNYYYDTPQCKPALFGEKLKNAETKQDWQSFNLSKSKARSILKENAEEIEKYQIGYWKRQAEACKNNAAGCETTCLSNNQQAPLNCKESCGAKRCEEFYGEILNLSN